MMCWQRERLERCEEGGSKPASNFWTPGWSKKESVRAFREREWSESTLIYGFWNSSGIRFCCFCCLCWQLSVSSPGTLNIASQIPCLHWVWKTVRKTSGHQEKQRERMKGVSSVIMVCMHGACRSFFTWCILRTSVWNWQDRIWWKRLTFF